MVGRAADPDRGPWRAIWQHARVPDDLELSPDALMAEACRLAEETVANGWGGPFGAVIADGGRIVARGQNLVLRTGDPTAHAEVVAIRNACVDLNLRSVLELVPRRPGDDDPAPERARMLLGLDIYASGAPCPMCWSAIGWARLDRIFYASDWDAARSVGFDDAHQYADLARPPARRRTPMTQLRPDLAEPAFAAWRAAPHRHPY